MLKCKKRNTDIIFWKRWKINPSKKNVLDSTKEDYEELKSIDEILTPFEISNYDYEEALSISDKKYFQIRNHIWELCKMNSIVHVSNYNLNLNVSILLIFPLSSLVVMIIF